MFIQKYVSLLICIVLYFASSKQGFCYGNQMIDPSKINRNSTNVNIFNVLTYGAKGDGKTNDAQAFVKTWDAACKVNGGVMLVPAGLTFLLQTVNFTGSSCKPNIVVQVDGKIVAPAVISEWVTTDFQWIQFSGNSKGITIKGNGVIDGHGQPWWKAPTVRRPHALRIVDSSNVIVTGITIQNPPLMHIFIEAGQYLKIFNFTTLSPADSPNTDGIHITNFQHVEIHNSNLSCGDDCVSIQTGCSDVKIYEVNCGPGHGFSIGGLGPDNTQAVVTGVNVFNSAVRNSLTGVRIKTWPGGTGYVRDVKFSNIQMSQVATPIVIDQDYCGGLTNCTLKEKNALSISNVTYEKITGTFTYTSVSLRCSSLKPCKDLTFATINLAAVTSSTNGPECSNAYGNLLTNTTPSLEKCLRSSGGQAPRKPPQLDYTYVY